MTIKECYEAMGDNYDNVLKRFALKFLNEKSYQNIKEYYAK